MTCNRRLGYCVEAVQLVVLPEAAASADGSESGAALSPEPALSVEVALNGGKRERFLPCKNYTEHDTCNWLVREADGQPYCLSCRLTEIIPDLTDAKNRQAWAEVESAKRRLLYTLRALRLPVSSKLQDSNAGLAFRFLRSSDEAPVTTGHADGLVTLNVAEADAAYCENMREKLGEGYRTVLGHLRHEIGHYYWDRLVKDATLLEGYRQLFGDERASYEDAIRRHYGEGPPPNWADSFISAYATMHPWEDWAETWAHYLHMLDTLETAKAHGLTVRVPGMAGSSGRVSTNELTLADFEALMEGWQAVTLALNSLSRSMGVKDVYPFVVSQAVRAKLRFVHDVIIQAGTKQPSIAREAPKPTLLGAAAK